jgi:hypothetical protein
MRVAENVQFVSLVHCTQRLVDVSQTGVPPPAAAHCVSLVHEMTQRLVVVLQIMPASPQLAFVRHSTHWPADEQTRPFVHCESLVHCTHE